jgi:hypothetical protein
MSTNKHHTALLILSAVLGGAGIVLFGFAAGWKAAGALVLFIWGNNITTQLQGRRS